MGFGRARLLVHNGFMLLGISLVTRTPPALCSLKSRPVSLAAFCFTAAR
jgi:hypothetical protein